MPKVKDMTTSLAGIDAIAKREGGYRERAYDDRVGRLDGKPDAGAKGLWTIGPGFIWRTDENGNRVRVKQGDFMPVDEQRAQLRAEVVLHEDGIQLALGPDCELAQNQYDALSDHCFQFGRLSLAGAPIIGEGGKLVGRRGSSIQRAILNNEPWALPAAFGLWRKSGGKYVPGIYNRSMARLCQYNGLPWAFCYDSSPENRLMTVDDDGRILSQIPPEIVLAKARAFSAAAGAPAASDRGVPDAPAPMPADPPAPEEKEAPIVEEPLPEVGAPASRETVPVDAVPLPKVKKENGAKPQTDSRRFWESVWLAVGHMFIDLSKKGAFAFIIPGWLITYFADVIVSPYVIGALVTLTLSAITLLFAGWIMVRRALPRLARAIQEATQVTY